MKLLLAIDSLGGGGAERVMAQLANGLDASRYDIEIAMTLGSSNVQDLADHVSVMDLTEPIARSQLFDALPESERQEIERHEKDAASIIRFLSGDHVERDPPLWFEIRGFRLATILLGRHIAASRPDCIISFLPNTNMLALLARAFYGFRVPIICADHNHLSTELANLPWPVLRRYLIPRHYPLAERHVAVAQEEGDDLVEQFGIPSEKVVTIPNGVDIERVRRLAGQSLDAEPRPGSPGELRIVTVGRLTRQKGYDILLRALVKVNANPWRLFLIGQGEEEHSLRALAAKLEIEDKVEFLGWQANPYAWMARSDVFVLSSRWEALPLVLLEALALGLPVIATDAPGASSSVLEGGRYGRLVSANSVDALAAALNEVLSDEHLRHELSGRASERAAVFSVSAMIAGYEQLLNTQSTPGDDASDRTP